ncbi:hypothetical protein GCM10007862_32770 [Dyella lipolytica]|uniref:Uncharacterized protein n=1 Tax=Dyella lipolytica TaxID=1867835 RepID=A0ABW8IWL8_9GAMM|nr:hypothetical protein [Dyella lipolytica]GLQ48226.1 hypothetical protein GCM10007862_32770 [Dyella lipolytica]
MILHDGLLLLGGVVALYLYDSALLLYHNEVILISSRRGCRISGGSAFELGGRYVFLPLPLFPHQPLFRLTWPQQGVFDGSVQPVRFHRVRVALEVIAPWTLLLLALFVVGLPYVLFVSRNATALLAWLAVVYAVIVVTLMQVYRYRKALNLSSRAVAAIALDAVLCAPFALNVIRKIGLRQRVDVDLRTVAATMLPAPALHDLTGILRERIKTSLGFVDPDTAASRALDAYLNYFEGLRK